MSYIPLEISSDYLASGLLPSMRAMRLPKGGESDSTHKNLGAKDAKLAAKLVKAGPDHAKAMRGIVVWIELRMQVGWMIEFETYRHGVECLSTSSSMHGELSRLSGADLAEQKQADLPNKVYIRICTISYQALRSMYRARRRHRHPDWRIFCDFIETLPYFESLIYPEAQKISENKCKAGDHIIHNGKKMIVSQVVDRGRDSYQRTDKKGSYCVAAKKADVTACRIMKDGQILTRSPIYIGDGWEYVQ